MLGAKSSLNTIYSSKKPPLSMEDISKNVPIPNFISSSEIFKGKDRVIWMDVPSILDDIWEGGVAKPNGF